MAHNHTDPVPKFDGECEKYYMKIIKMLTEILSANQISKMKKKRRKNKNRNFQNV